MNQVKKRLEIMQSLKKDGYRTSDGVLRRGEGCFFQGALVKGSDIVDVLEADRVAQSHGFMYAENLIRFMEGKDS